MHGKRTEIDFSNHDLIVTKSDGLLIHWLKQPDSSIDNIKYINILGNNLVVTGDYSNWIFCREFHPTAEGYVSDMYWKEKLKNSSCQEPADYDSERTIEAIKEILNNPERDLSEGEIDWLNDLLRLADDEINYLCRAFRNNNINWDAEQIPYVKTVKFHFLAILDGFDEICRRLKEGEKITLA